MKKLAIILLIMTFAVACSTLTVTDVTPSSIESVVESETPTALGVLSPEQPMPTPTETNPDTEKLQSTTVNEWKPGWSWFQYESDDFPFGIAYLGTWGFTVDQYRQYEIRFQSPESGSEIIVTVFTTNLELTSKNWVTWAQENRDRVFPFTMDIDAQPTPQVNTQYRGQDAIFISSSGRSSGLGTQAVMLFPDEGDVYRIYLHGADWLEAEREIYQTMLTSFTLHGEADSDYVIPHELWSDEIEAIETSQSGD